MLIVVVFIAVAVTLFLIGNKKTVLSPTNNVSSTPGVVDINSLNIPAGDSRILGYREDLVASSIWAGEEVHGLLAFSGSVKGGYFFEGNIVINILDVNKKVLKASNAMAKTDWMTAEPVVFEGKIDFTGLPKGPAYFEIHNDNPSGLSANDKSILIPIVIK